MAKKGNEYLTFRMTNGRKPVSWGLSIKRLMLTKKDSKTGRVLGQKLVQYVPGEDSIFKEDHSDDKRPETPTFEYGLLRVHKHNKALVELMLKHPHKGVHYDIVNEDKEAEKELETQEKIKLALNKVDLAQEDEIRATGIVLLGQKTIGWSKPRIKVKLQKMAIENPAKIIEEIGTNDYNAKYIAALSLMKGVVEENASKTAVVWANTKKSIVNVATGQNSVVKLGAFLSENTDSAKVTLQELGEQLKKPYLKKEEDTGEDKIQEISKEEVTEGAPKPEETKNEELPKQEKDASEDNLEEYSLEELQEEYSLTFKKNVPVNKKNDADWIKSKILEERK